MDKRVIFDAHCDTIQVLTDNKGSLNDLSYSVNIPDALAQSPYIQCMATFVHPKYSSNNQAFNRANDILDKFDLEYRENISKMKLIKKSDDFKKVIDMNLFGVILSIENGSAIQGDLSNIRHLYERGVRMMGITWNDDNDLACGAKTSNDTGITRLGKKYIKELNKRKIAVDVSHVSEKSFYDIIDITDSPIIASHSCAKSLCDHKRNLSDNQIKKIAETGGIIGIAFYDKFLDKDGNSTIRTITEHIDYIANIAGINHVGIGTDFEGIERDELPSGITGIRDISNLFDMLKEQGYSEEEIYKVAGGNFVNVFSKIINKDKKREDFTR